MVSSINSGQNRTGAGAVAGYMELEMLQALPPMFGVAGFVPVAGGCSRSQS
jgi:hypothetical protein